MAARPSRLGLALALALPAALAVAAPAHTRGDDADVAAVVAWLRRTHPGANWQSGPARLDGPAVRAVYPGRRFYAVRSHPPLPPGAYLPGLLEAHARAVEEWRAHHYISARVVVSGGGRVAPLDTAADFNAGLRPARGQRALATRAAAFMTLLELSRLRTAIRPDEPRLARTASGWTASLGGVAPYQQCAVELDAAGRLVSWVAAPEPLPPAAAPTSFARPRRR